MKKEIVFQMGSHTIRQMPENYLLAHWNQDRGCWICEPDLSADREMAKDVFLFFMDYGHKYEKFPNILEIKGTNRKNIKGWKLVYPKSPEFNDHIEKTCSENGYTNYSMKYIKDGTLFINGNGLIVAVVTDDGCYIFEKSI